MTSVLKPWVQELPLMQQSVLISALRGCDGRPKDDPAKPIVRWIRTVVCVDAMPKGDHSYMSVPRFIDIDPFLDQLESYPLHFVTHLMHALEVIGYQEGTELGQKGLYWYTLIVGCLHLNVESRDQMNARLSN